MKASTPVWPATTWEKPLVEMLHWKLLVRLYAIDHGPSVCVRVCVCAGFTYASVVSQIFFVAVWQLCGGSLESWLRLKIMICDKQTAGGSRTIDGDVVSDKLNRMACGFVPNFILLAAKGCTVSCCESLAVLCESAQRTGC